MCRRSVRTTVHGWTGWAERGAGTAQRAAPGSLAGSVYSVNARIMHGLPSPLGTRILLVNPGIVAGPRVEGVGPGGLGQEAGE
jgi:hypothetical protein